jgi:hypothetical protein
MGRVIEIIKIHTNEEFIEEAEKELGFKYIYKGFDFVLSGEQTFNPFTNETEELYTMVPKTTAEEEEKNQILSKRAGEIETETWNELFVILKGQDHEDYLELFTKSKEENELRGDLWDNWFDGSGLKQWWN